MPESTTLSRRQFLASTAVAGAVVLSGAARAADPGTLKIGIRAASLKLVGTPDVFRVAASIGGIGGVELQAMAGQPNLRDDDTVRRYQQEAQRWKMAVPSLAGIWDRGVQIHSPRAANDLRASIRAAEMLGAGVILAAFFRQNAPDMVDESSYGPVVDTLQKVAPQAASAGVVIGLENSLSPADNKKLVDLVDHAAVKVYYDLHNMAHYGHAAQAIDGVHLLGRQRIAMVHVKNGNQLLSQPGPIDWPAAFRALGEIGYDGWYVYETGHESTQQCVQDTRQNNAFLHRHIKS